MTKQQQETSAIIRKGITNIRRINIDKDKTYYFTSIARNGWLGSTSVFTCKRIITECKDILRPEYVGVGRATRILITGEDLLKFIKQKNG